MVTNPKRDIQAPCRYEYLTDSKELKDTYPDVNCSLNCKTCGWNPEEKQRRLTEGRFETRVKTLELHDDKGKEVIATITEPLNTLVFPRREIDA